MVKQFVRAAMESMDLFMKTESKQDVSNIQRSELPSDISRKSPMSYKQMNTATVTQHINNSILHPWHLTLHSSKRGYLWSI